MPIVERLVVKFDADFKSLDAKFGTMERRVTEGGRRIARVGGMLTLGVTLPLLAAGAASIKFAADAEEAGNKFDVVMGSAVGRATDEIDRLHKTIPAARAELVGMAASIQDLVKPLGLATEAAATLSLKTLEVAGDLASFNNVRIDEVLLAIRSGFVGQSEPLLRFGADVRVAAVKAKALELGLMSLGGVLTNAARITAVLSIVMESNTDAMGDAERTMDSTSNSIKFLVRDFKDLADTIGQALIPVILPLVRGTSEVAVGFQALSPWLQNTAVGFALVATAAGPVLAVIGGLVAAVGVLAGAGITLAAALGAAALLAALTAAAAGMLIFLGRTKEAKAGVDDLAASIRDAGATDFAGMSTDALREEIELLQRRKDIFREGLRQNLGNVANREGLARATRELVAAEAELLARRGPPAVLVDNTALALSVDILERLGDRADSLSDHIADSRMDLRFEEDEEAAKKLTLQIAAMVDELERVNEAITRQRLGGVGVSARRVRVPTPGVDTSPEARKALAAQTRAIAFGLQPLVDSAEDSASGLDKVSTVARALAPELGGFGQLLGSALSGLATGGFLGLGVTLGAQLLGMIGGGVDTDAVLQQNTEALRRNTAAINATLLGTSAALIEAIREGLAEGLDLLGQDFGGLEAVNALVAALERAGFSMSDFHALMGDINFELVGSVDGFRQLQERLNASVFSGLGGQLDLAQMAIDFGDVTDPAEQFALIQSALAGVLPGGVSGIGIGVARLDTETIGAFAQGILEQVAAGTFDLAQLGDVSLEEFLAAIGQLESLGDAADSAADALNAVASIVNQPSGFKVALERFNATMVGDTLPPSPIQPAGPGGVSPFGGGVTIENLTVHVDGPEGVGRRVVEEIKLEFERENARGGADSLNLSVVEA